MPESRRQMTEGGKLFGVPASRWLPAEARLEVEYCAVMARADLFSSRRRHPRLQGAWSSDVCSSDLVGRQGPATMPLRGRAMRASWTAECPLSVYRSEERRVGKEGRSRWSPYH